MRLSRRDALLITSASLVGLWAGGLSCQGRKREPWASGPRLRNGHPILRMPFPAGMAVLCQQGNLAPAGRTHSKDNCLHALDLSNASVPSVDVVAAARGRVAHVYSASTPGDTKAGLGFGNHVKVEHGDGYFTMYAHLDQVLVRVGEVVGDAGKLGTMGFTGAAGNRHLHFSLHQGNPDGMGVYETMAMDALVAADLSAGEGFKAMSSTSFRDGMSDLWRGAIYGSENDSRRAALSGPAPPEIDALLGSSLRALNQIINDRIDLDTVSNLWEQNGASWARALVTPILERAPRHPIARYWLATAVESAERRWKEAETILQDLLVTGSAEPTWEAWLPACIHNRLGVIALERGETSVAYSRFMDGARLATADPERTFAVAHLRRLRDAARGSAPPP
jgi:hypothetical protein